MFGTDGPRLLLKRSPKWTVEWQRSDWGPDPLHNKRFWLICACTRLPEITCCFRLVAVECGQNQNIPFTYRYSFHDDQVPMKYNQISHLQCLQSHYSNYPERYIFFDVNWGKWVKINYLLPVKFYLFFFQGCWKRILCRLDYYVEKINICSSGSSRL